MILALIVALLGQPVNVRITVHDDVVGQVPSGFFGVHYDGPRHKYWNPVLKKEELSEGSTFTSPAGRHWLNAAGVEMVRLFATIQAVHPGPEEWNLADVKAQVAEIRAAGMEPMVCLNQSSGKWFMGDAKNPWWNDPNGLEQWRLTAYKLAETLKGSCRYFEILNEPNHIERDQDNYVGWARSVELFRIAATEIKAAIPDAKCGGPASWAAWETAEWARHALGDEKARRLVDFVSYHIYTSHDLDDSDAAIMAKMVWFEQTPRYIRQKLAGLTDRPVGIMLTECNVSAVTSKDGKPYQDPRNTNAFGGVWMASALLHSVRGGCNAALHFCTLGGLGIIRWPPDWRPQHCYYVLPMLRDAAGMEAGARLLRTETTEQPVEVRQVVKGKSKDYGLESFAIDSDGGLAVVLVNKRADRTYRATVVLPEAPGAAELYRYSTQRVGDAPYPLRTIKPSDEEMAVQAPPYSVTVLSWRQRTRPDEDG